MTLKNDSIQDLLNKKIPCSCGKVHQVDIEDIVIKVGAIDELPCILAKYGYKKLFLVADNHTHDAAGQKVEHLLKKKGFDPIVHIFKRAMQLVPDEKTVGEFLIHTPRETEIIIAIGTGTLNDLSKFVSYQLGIPYIIVATAPSMDGFSSMAAPLIVDHLKTTYEGRPPKAIIADIAILKEAPIQMISAGLGDILGKYTCLCDWELSGMINGEYYCEYIVNLVRKSIEKCVSSAQGFKNRDEKAITHLTEGLVLSGIAMSFAGNSRPASGAEHHLAHFLEMMFLFRGREAVLHGTKVGMTTIAVLKLYQMLKSEKIDFVRSLEEVSHFNERKWEQKIMEIYQAGAPSVLVLEEKVKKNSLETHQERLKVIQKKWTEIIKTIDRIIPQLDLVEGILLKVGAPVNPMQIGIDSETFYNALIYGKEMRNRYTILQLLWDLGLLEEFSRKVVHYFFQEHLPVSDSPFSVNRRKEIFKQVKSFILDMDGTFYLGNTIIDGALGFLEQVKNKGKTFFFFTNNSSRNAKYYQGKLAKMGCFVEQKDILTSNQVILKHLQQNLPGKKVFLLGNQYLREDFEAAGIELVEKDPDLVIVGFDTTLSYDRVSQACTFIRKGISFLAVNPDFNCPVEHGFIPDCGSICAMMTASTGVKPIVFGKPSRFTLQYLLSETGLKEEEIAYIGDRLYTDIAMGVGNKMNTILVLSGETKLEDLNHSTIQPDLVFTSLKEIKERWDEMNP